MDKARDITVAPLAQGFVMVASATTQSTERLQEMADLAIKGNGIRPQSNDCIMSSSSNKMSAYEEEGELWR